MATNLNFIVKNGLVLGGDIQQENAAYLKSKLANGTGTRVLGINASNDVYIGSIDTATGGSTLFLNGTERMRIDTVGNVGIGTQSPTNKLSVSNGGAAGFEINPSGGAGGGPALIAYNRSGTAYIPITTYADTHTWWTGTQGFSMALDTTGRLGLGTQSPTYQLDIQGTGGSPVSLTRFGAFVSSTSLTLAHSRGTTVGSNVLLAADDIFGSILFNGANGTSYSTGAIIRAEVDGTPGASNDMPGRLMFLTTPDGSGTSVERMRIDSYGNVGIGTTAPVSKLNVNTNSATAVYATIGNTVNGLSIGVGPTGVGRVGSYAGAPGIEFGTSVNSTWTPTVFIDSNGNLAIGVASAKIPPSSNYVMSLSIERAATWVGAAYYAYSNIPGAGGILVLGRSKSSTLGSLAATASDDALGVVSFEGVNSSSALAYAAALFVKQDGAAGSASIPTRFEIHTGTSAAAPAERMRIDSSGNVCIGTASGTARLNVQSVPGTASIAVSGNTTAIAVADFSVSRGGASESTAVGQGACIQLSNGTNNSNVILQQSSNALQIFNFTGSTWTERMRVAAGGEILMCGKTSVATTGAGAYFEPVAGIAYGRLNFVKETGSGTGNTTAIAFYYSGTQVGTIQNSSTATVFATSSDRRLKENIVPASSFGAVIDAIQVVEHDWKAGGHVRAGMIAQDLAEVVPEAVNAGDAGEEIADTWGVDYSKLVPMLVKEIQELRARLAAAGL